MNERTKQDPMKESSKQEEDTCEEVGESSDGGRSVSQGRCQILAMVPSPGNGSGNSLRRQSPVKQALTISRITGEISGEKDFGKSSKISDFIRLSSSRYRFESLNLGVNIRESSQSNIKSINKGDTSLEASHIPYRSPLPGIASGLGFHPLLANSTNGPICDIQNNLVRSKWEVGHDLSLGPQTEEVRISPDRTISTERMRQTLEVPMLGNFSKQKKQGRDNITQVTSKIRPEEHKIRKWKSRARSKPEQKSKTEREVGKKRSVVDAGGEPLSDEGICCATHKKSRFELTPTGHDD
ncbi:hypothetical protein U1Q18_031423 [Sarracenia purpurea var. burkii]